MEKELTALVEDLKKAHADNLVSIVLYGSAAAGEYVQGQSDLNVLVVLRHIGPEDLRASRPVVERWQKRGNPPPVYFTEEEMTRASDVFPIEFSDMSRVHRVMYGSDPFHGLEIREHNLRHQLEYELRSKLIRLRALYIPVSEDAKRLRALMVDSLRNFIVLFRHTVRLLGAEPPLNKRAAVLRLGEVSGVEVKPFLDVLALAEDGKKLSLEQMTERFTAYLAGLEAVIRRIDELEGG